MGIFSEVYKAPALRQSENLDSALTPNHEFVALKVTTPHMMEPPHDSKKEVRILKAARSRNVIELLDSFQQAGGRLVLVFPFMPYDLAQLLHAKKLSTGGIKSALRDMFAAIDYIHGHGVIHRDIKPSNILLKSPSGPTCLADFGIAWIANDPGCEPAAAKITDVGTTCYRPPELLFGNKAYGPSLDLWAAGCVVAEATNGTNESLFDSGELGSDLALIQSIFKCLGTPTSATWPEADTLPDWNKVRFHDYPTRSWEELLPGSSPEARNLVSNLVKFESRSRISAGKALEHEYFAGV